MNPQVDPDIPKNYRIIGGGSLLSDDADILPTLHEEWWIRVASGESVFVCTLAESYSGCDKFCIVAYPHELKFVIALLNGYALAEDDRLTREVDAMFED